MKRPAGFISAQCHRATGDSATHLNDASRSLRSGRRSSARNCRVGEDVATLAPHSPERALLAHSVLHARDSFSQT